MPVSRARRIARIVSASLASVVVLGLLAWAWSTWSRVPDDPNAVRSGPFLATPYLQLGDDPKADSLALLWHADDVEAPWSVEVRSPLDGDWRAAGPPSSRPARLDGVEPQRIYRATLTALTPGEGFSYRVKLGAEVVYASHARAKPAAGRPQRFVAFGDCAANTAGQRKVAYQAGLLKPDYLLITGDIVYFQGRIGEYRPRYFPIYEASVDSPSTGSGLLGRTLSVAVPGNHDLMINDFDANADLLAYYYFWSQPLNGPDLKMGGPNATPLVGNQARRDAFVKLAGANFPRMANFSFDAGDVHWTVLDANPYVQWADPSLRAWVRADLEAARDKPWRFVAFHHPGFHSSVAHKDEQQMRLLADLFEAGGVSIAFSGHVHNYQRSYPLKFAATTYPDGHAPMPATPVEGRWTLDKAYDGTAATRPDGVIYVVTGAGGARLYDAAQTGRPKTWQPFTKRFIGDVHSLTVVDVTAKAATVRQLDADGATIDEFTVAR